MPIIGNPIILSGGGGDNLNLSVIGGTTKPSVPSENMIWLNTSNTITNWCISNTAPDSPEEGDVYITNMGLTSNVVNISDSNTVLLYVGNAWQYISGAWVKLEGEIYFNNSWHNLDMYVYNGLIGSASGNFNPNIGGYPWFHQKTWEEYDDHFRWGNAGAAGAWYCSTGQSINMTDISKVVFEFTSTSSSSGTYKFGVFLEQSVSSAGNPAVGQSYTSAVSQKQTLELDVSELTGNYYIGMHYTKSSSSGGKFITVYSIKLIS